MPHNNCGAFFMKKILLLITLFFVISTATAQLYTVYSKPSNIDSLVQRLFANPNVQISNVSFTGLHLPSTGINGDIKDIGFFNSQNSTVNIDSGIILTSGLLAPPFGLGQPASVSADFFKPTDGDSLLNTLLLDYPTNFSIGAAVLEFDFIPNGDSIKFEYVFASDEYPQQLCIDDNDVFAFFISGPGISGVKNIALVPNSNLPVCIKSINDTSIVPYYYTVSNCYSVSNSQYYVNHLNDNNFIFNGSTTVLTAKEKTIPCQTYHMKFAIAEVGSLADNSAVFLKANSFNSEPLKITPSLSYGGIVDSLLYEGCGYANLILRRTYNIQQPKTYNLSLSGTAQNNSDYTGLTNQVHFEAGQMYDTVTIIPVFDNIADDGEAIIVTIGDTLCNGNYYEAKATIIISESHNLDVIIKPDSGLYCDTVRFVPLVTGGFSPYSFSWNNGLSNDSIFNYYSEGTQTITLQVSDACGSSVEKNVTIDFRELLIADFSYYPDSISILKPEVTFNNLSSNNAISWLWDFDYLHNYSNAENPIFNFELPGNYNIKLLIENSFGCRDSIYKVVTINDYSDINFSNVFTPNDDGCNDTWYVDSKTLKIAELKIFNRWGQCVCKCENEPFSWNGGLLNNSTNMVSPGVYFFTIIYEDFKGNHTKTGSITIIN